ncbi:hypothetical protein UFOVP1636_341 [uncultured Caudovirales phage]|uniref:Uncharacterized protein n=1 Tax=uncultured Caudovirales phage TaxID=2100421 RepID=A0A6J5T1U7_9CAUD|nr:hypothetical protein UFOVP1636_341 [uncultured Caudovirales phage]
MTTNAFIFSWDQLGIEAIIPISQYEHYDQENLLRMIASKDTVRNPLTGIVQSLVLRARYNPQRHYEIYAVDCTEEMDEVFWREQWEEYPQATAELIRERGHKLYSDRAETHKVKIT